jgi:hypothetical protein
MDALKRSTIVYANNVVFESTTNDALVRMWREHLPACATMVVFDETAILSSGESRNSRTKNKLEWASRIDTLCTHVSWQPNHDWRVYLWNVSPIYTAMRNWASSVALEDLLGWAICHAKAVLIHGDESSTSWKDSMMIIQSDISVIYDDWSFLTQALSLFIVIKSSTKDYQNAQDQVVQHSKHQQVGHKIGCICIIDGSQQNIVVDTLLNKLSKLAKVASSLRSPTSIP